jgi:hypothetical protein
MWRPVLMVDREWLAQIGLLVPSLVRSPLGVVVLIALLVGGPGCSRGVSVGGSREAGRVPRSGGAVCALRSADCLGADG